MSRTPRWSLLVAALAVGGGSLWGMASSNAVAGDHPVTLAPTAPALGSAFSAAGDGCVGGTMNVTVQNLVLGANTNAVANTDPDGSWTADWTSSWGDGEGWYQVIGNCAGFPELGYWTSDIFLVDPTVDILPVVLHQGVAPDESPTLIYAAGSGCAQGNLVQLNAYDASGAEIYSASAAPEADGTWTTSTFGTLTDGLTWYGGCDVDGFLDPLYEATASAPGTTTTTTTPGTTTTTTAPAAAAAGAVAASPTFTG